MDGPDKPGHDELRRMRRRKVWLRPVAELWVAGTVVGGNVRE